MLPSGPFPLERMRKHKADEASGPLRTREMKQLVHLRRTMVSGTASESAPNGMCEKRCCSERRMAVGMGRPPGMERWWMDDYGDEEGRRPSP